jgi:hypothetical protein
MSQTTTYAAPYLFERHLWNISRMNARVMALHRSNVDSSMIEGVVSGEVNTA